MIQCAFAGDKDAPGKWKSYRIAFLFKISHWTDEIYILKLDNLHEILDNLAQFFDNKRVEKVEIGRNIYLEEWKEN